MTWLTAHHQTPIRLTKHAAIRFEERVTFPWEESGVEMPGYIERRLRGKARRKLVNHIRSRLLAALKQGVKVKNDAVYIGLEGGYEAVLVPDMGCWTVVTILEPPIPIIDKKENEEKVGEAV